MDVLPLELQDLIVAFSCTDGGFTACSLRMVSRHFHELTIPHRFHSVAIAGLTQLSSFVRQLGATPTEQCRIHHLFISDCTPQEASEKYFDGCLGVRTPYTGRTKGYPEVYRRRLKLQGDERALYLYLPPLLSLVHANLFSLTILIYHAYFDIFSALAQFTFPHLNALSLKPSISRRNSSFDMKLRMPALRALCIAPTPGLPKLYPLLRRLAASSPNLQQVTLRDVRARLCTTLVTRAHLGHVLTSEDWTSVTLEDQLASATTRSPFPRAITHVVIEPLSADGSDETPGWGSYEKDKLAEAHRCIECLGAIRDEGFVLNQPRRQAWSYDEWKKEWLGLPGV
jgi:hypothetical protein